MTRSFSLTGNITSNGIVDVDPLVRDVIRDAGYVSCKLDFDFTCGRICDEIKYRRNDDPLSGSVDSSQIAPEIPLADGQGVMVGYASNETPSFLDTPSYLARELTSRLTEVQESGVITYLRPDADVSMYVEYELGEPVKCDLIALSTQHEPSVGKEQLERDLMEHVILPVIPHNLLPCPKKILINPTGRFVKGGPAREPGLSGRRSIFLEYGNGPWYWADVVPRNDSLVNRWGAYAARWISKTLVAAGVADRIEVRIIYAAGMESPISVSVQTFESSEFPNEVFAQLVHEHFDLRPSMIISELGLRTPLYWNAAAAGHFGRAADHLPWERTEIAAAIRRDLGSME